MGVHGLWELLAPVGRRVSVETLAGKKLAIDASIWMVQFMKAMRDEKGEMVHNAHLIGFFRRICKLLFLRTKPVFVFDGTTPALKRRTVAARRRHRDNARAKIRKTAEKLLLNHLKAKRLEELAADIKKQREGSKEKRTNNDAKGKKAFDLIGDNGVEGSRTAPVGNKEIRVYAQENIDELLAASLAAEEGAHTNNTEPMGDLAKDETDDDEEMILPTEDIQIDPAVLASLPPSMQLDLLVQMRERVMAENRQKYQKIKKAPTKFSELQIQSYLKTIAFRREIDEVQKSAAGRGIAGVHASRIASEANREFIFSSSFTGDKQLFTTAVGTSGNQDHHSLTKPSTSDSTKSSLFASQPELLKEVSVGQSVKDFGPDVETYYDESGHLRVSRVRGLGIRMTRDLQRNLVLMKEHEQEKRKGDSYSEMEASCTPEVVGTLVDNSENVNPSSAPVNSGGKNETTRKQIVQGSKSAIEVSFPEDESGMNDMDVDDNIFMQLVSEGQTPNLPMKVVNLDKSTNDSEYDCIWRERFAEGFSESPKGNGTEVGGSSKSCNSENQSYLAERTCIEEDMEWEEGVCHDPQASSQCQSEAENHVSKGLLEEEADMQEAIRRSLLDFNEQISLTVSSQNHDLEGTIKGQRSVHLDNDSGRIPPQSDRQLDNSSKVDLQVADSSKMSLCSSHLDGDSSPENRHKDELNMMLAGTDDVPPDKICDGHQSLLEQSLDSNEVQNNFFSNSSMEEFFNSNPNTNYKTASDGSLQGDPNHDDFHLSRSNMSFGKGHNNTFSENSSLMEEMIVNTSTAEPQAVSGINITSNRIETNRENSKYHQIEISEANLDNEISLLRQEREDLGDQQRVLERNAESVSNEMFAECQELLQMFGLPYIIAPTEAEAQCAYMEMEKLVDGVVTDDSDVFLFGARSVFKNIFDDRKYVETYFMKDIESELGLNREKLIRMAMLLGSDYTEGVSGIGIVNAIEVVHAFPEEDGLQKFREWIESPDPAILGKLETGSNTKKRSSKESTNDADAMNASAERDASEEALSRVHGNEKPTGSGAIKEIFMNNHRNVSKNWHIPPSFPSESVINAYISPEIDDSTEPFTWGKPDLPLLRKLCWTKFGWTNQKADELLVPVLKEYNKHETQLRLEAFYTFNERFAKIRSQRIKKALKGITGALSSDLADDLVKDGPCSSKNPENSSGDNPKRGKKVIKHSRGRKLEKEIMHSEDVTGGSHIREQGDIGDNGKFSVKERESGRKGRGRGRGRGRGGRSSPLKSDSEYTDGGNSDDSNTDAGMDNHSVVFKAMPKLRRSMRPLKQVQYAEKDLGADKENGTPEQCDHEQELIESDNRKSVEGFSEVDKVTEPFSTDCSSREYLFSGGGFCVDENDKDDAAELVAEPNTDTAEGCSEDRYGKATGWDGHRRSPEDISSRDHLLSGGGFCIDENDEPADATRPSIMKVSEPQNSGLGNSVPDDDAKAEPLQESSLLIEKNTSHQGGKTNLGLSAMPSLRRKRRKRT